MISAFPGYEIRQYQRGIVRRAHAQTQHASCLCSSDSFFPDWHTRVRKALPACAKPAKESTGQKLNGKNDFVAIFLCATAESLIRLPAC